jgi:hypothetical protein
MILRLTLILTILCLPVLAQELPSPAKELARLHRLLGTWEGEGTSTMAADAPEITWTGRTTVRKVLGGHFLREETRIKLSDPFPATIGFIAHYGWDAGEERYVSYAVDSMGKVASTELIWLDNDTLISTATTMEQGKPVIERWITHFEGDTQKFTSEKASGSEAFFTQIRGTMKKVDDAKPVDLKGVGATFGAAAPEMERLGRMAGRYRVSGAYRMGPDREMVPFEGLDTYTSIFGGQILVTTAAGDGYEAWSGKGWDPLRQRYVFVELNNWGMAHTTEAWFTDDHHLASMIGGMWMGQPMRARTIVELDDHGRPKKAHSHILRSSQKPYMSFESTYVPEATGEKTNEGRQAIRQTR